MIIPMNNGRSITTIYIPQPVVTTNSGLLQQTDANVQNNEPTFASWIVLGVALIFLIVCVVYLIKLINDFFRGEE